MFKIIAGAIVGWTSARLLPPPSHERLQPPTMDELKIIAQKTQDFVIAAQQIIQKKMDKPPPTT